MLIYNIIKEVVVNHALDMFWTVFDSLGGFPWCISVLDDIIPHITDLWVRSTDICYSGFNAIKVAGK